MIKKYINSIRYKWSEIRHLQSPIDADVPEQMLPKNMHDIERVAKKLYKRFEYTMDGIDKLFDSMNTPAACWKIAWENPPLRDDCDGFHAALYWVVKQVFNNSYLVTMVTTNIKDSHTFLGVTNNDKYYYIDYTYVSKEFDTVDNMIDHIKKRRNVSGILFIEKTVWEDKWQTRR